MGCIGSGMYLLFREKRGITPYQFAKTDFSRTDLVYQEKHIPIKRKPSVPSEVEGR